jgi:hypothetical protein
MFNGADQGVDIGQSGIGSIPNGWSELAAVHLSGQV